jgi:tripartite-type tricarboxylate transporter receptor subunit TctC
MLKIIVAFAAIACACVTNATAQEFPAKPVTLMMPYAAGGPGDAITRIVGAGMSKVLGRQFLVENTAGAGGTIGTAKVAAAPPDGYSLLVMHLGHAANVALYPNLRYDAVADFEPIGMIVESPMAFVARKDFPADNFKDFVAYVKANKEKVTYGHAGIGSASHLCGLLFFSAIETTVTTVPYKGTGPALNDLVGGQFDFMCDQTLNVLQPVGAGLIKALAVTTPARLAVAPSLPTAAEAGLPGFQTAVWFAMYAPKGTPKPVIDKLSAALQEALQDPEVKGRFAAAGAETVSAERARPEALRAHLAAEIAKWVPLIKKAGVYAE